MKCSVLGLCVAMTFLAGCTNGDSLAAPTRNPQATMWDIRFPYRAVTMAIGDTVSLAAVPMTAKGTPYGGLPSPTYTSSDTMLVGIGANGTVYAKDVADRIMIVVAQRNPNDHLTVYDTAYVSVTETRQEIASFSIQPDGGETTVPGAGVLNMLVTALTPASETAEGLSVFFTSSDPTGLQLLDPIGMFSGAKMGQYMVYGSTFAYGKLYRDSIQIRVTYPEAATVAIYPKTYYIKPSPSYLGTPNLTILQGGTVTFINFNADLPSDIVFDDLEHVEDGDIPDVPSYGTDVTFPTVGKFTYHSVKNNFGGMITVVAR